MASIRKKNGKWQAQVRRKGQPNISKIFQNRTDAEKWAREIEVKADRQELSQDFSILRRMSLGELVDRYRTEVTPKKKTAAAEGYVLSVFWSRPICGKKLSDISAADFAKYRDLRLLEIQSTSLRRELNPIQNMFEIARDEWGIPIKENPLTKLKLKLLCFLSLQMP